MNLFAGLVQNLLDTAVECGDTPEAGPAGVTPLTRVNRARTVEGLQRYMRALADGPLDTVEVGIAVGVTNPRTTLLNLKKLGYVKNVQLEKRQGGHTRKVWAATGKHLLPRS